MYQRAHWDLDWMNWLNLCETFLKNNGVVGKGCLLFSIFLCLSCIVTFDREGVSIFIVFSFSYYVVELEYLDRVGRKLDCVIVFYFGICPFLKSLTP